MSIIATCECGNRMALADALAGKSIVCSKCGDRIAVPAASAGPARAGARKKVDATSTVSISPGIIAAVVVGALLLVVVLTMYFGPWRVGTQWSAMSDTANDQVTDLVDFAIKAYESQNGMYDAAQSHMVPMTDGKATFVPPYMAFSMPRRIIFSGKTNQGNYMGTYDTTNGEVIADIETGGYSVGGLVDVKKASGKFHITGRVKDGHAEAECDGQPLKIVMHKL
jgi:hypothetical protein